MTTAETLRKAKAALLDRGWCQFVREDSLNKKVCLMGALSIAEAGNANSRTLMVSPAFRFLETLIGDGKFIWEWNDAPGRTLEQVLEMLDKAIKRAEVARKTVPTPERELVLA